MAPYRFWIHDKDRKGRPIDKIILATAEELAPAVTQYRRREVDCDATSNDLLQLAVEAASAALGGSHIKNPHGYLLSIYRRIVDLFLKREQKLVPVDDRLLEHLANARRASSFEDAIHSRIRIDQLLKSMDSETRQIYSWRSQGYSVKEIAKRMDTTTNAISMRWARGVKEARNTTEEEQNKGKTTKHEASVE